ncbi:unnamed protein product [Choristocarpus tenellus]
MAHIFGAQQSTTLECILSIQFEEAIYPYQRSFSNTFYISFFKLKTLTLQTQNGQSMRTPLTRVTFPLKQSPSLAHHQQGVFPYNLTANPNANLNTNTDKRQTKM